MRYFVSAERPRNIRVTIVSLGEKVAQPFIGGFEMFRDHPDLGHHGHETGIAVPPRDNMKMEMVIYPGAGYLAQIYPDIDPLGG